MHKLAFFMLFALSVASCSDCTDCEPFAEEPYFKIRFYDASDSTASIVVIDSINHAWAGNYEYYQDTVNTYQIPLNMQEDLSDFTITFRDTTDYNTYVTRDISVSYQRTFKKRADNNIEVQCSITSISSNFATSNLLCADSLTCLSNDAIYQIYR